MILSDNLRKFRRLLQGRGVNVREAVVTGVDADSADVRMAIPNLKDDDVITSMVDLTVPADVSGEIAMAREASTTIFTGAKGVKYTARKPGLAVANTTDEIKIKYTDTNVANDPLVVTVSRHADGYTLIDVQLAQSAGAVITTTAAQARAAVLQSQDAAKLVDVDLVSTGATLLTPSGPHKLGATIAGDVSTSVVGYLRRQGPTAAALVTAFALDADGLDGNIRFEAAVPGLPGGQGATSDITVAIGAAYPGDETETTVAVGPYNDIVVTVRALGGVTLATGDEVMAAIRASADASALVKVAAAHGNPTEGAPGVVEALAQTPLAGGEDSGVYMRGTDLDASKIIVKWVSAA